MLSPDWSLRDDFPPVDEAAWRALAEADLKGVPFEQKLITHTYEGIDIQPLYTRSQWPSESDPFGFPGLRTFARGGAALGHMTYGWDLRQEHTHPDLSVNNTNILDDLRGGVTSLLLRLDTCGRNGHEPADLAASEWVGRDGMMLYHRDDLRAALAGVHPEMIGITLEAGAAFLPAAALLVAYWRECGLTAEQMRGGFNADPLAVLARDGQLPLAPEAMLQTMADLACWTHHHLPNVTSVRVGTAPYHHAGATAAQDIAYSLATGVEYLRALTGAGLHVDAAAGQLLFSISVGTHYFLAIAKLRAVRMLWARVLEACAATPERNPMKLHARTSKRVLAERDPHVNLLRNTIGCYAAALGGADAITSEPFDSPLGPPDPLSRRIARNTVLILQEESHLHRVIDPAGGSWYLDRLTDTLADKAWTLFQQIERDGGMLKALLGGTIASQIDLAFSPRFKNLARRRDGLTGVSEFPNVSEPHLERAPIDRGQLRLAAIARLGSTPRPAQMGRLHPGNGAAMQEAVRLAEHGASIGQLATALGFTADAISIAPLTPHPFAEPFENLRDASDAWLEKTGHRPRVFLANLGPVAHHTARATYSKNFFEAGGFEICGGAAYANVDAAATALRESGAHLAVICSSDKLYPDLVPQAAPKLKEAGARTIILAGNPGANETAYRSAGVNRFIFIKCDVLMTLRELLREEGVLA